MASTLEVPAAMCVDLRCMPAAEGSGLVSVGLAQFGLMELEVAASSLPCGELRMRALNLCEWLIGQRPVVADGDTVSVGSGEPVRVSHAPSSFGGPGLVYQLSGL